MRQRGSPACAVVFQLRPLILFGAGPGAPKGSGCSDEGLRADVETGAACQGAWLLILTAR